MDFSLTDAQQDLAGLTRRIVGDHATHERLTHVETGPDRHDARLWSALADAGALAPTGTLCVALAPGDALVLYTDGLTEAGPSRREFLGVSGMADLVRAGDGDASLLVAGVVAGVQTYARGVLRDDACLLVGVVQ